MRAQQRSLWLALSGLSLVGLVGCDSPAFPADAVFRCQSNADCDLGEVCDTAIGGCVAAEGEGEGGEGEGEVGEGEGDVVAGEGEGEGGCAVDTDCDAGFTCEDDACVDLAPLSTAPGVSATSIRIGLSAALTAGPKEEGAAFADGVRAAFAERNAAGGVRHRSVELVALNDGGNPATAATNATTLTSGAQPAFALMASSSQTVAALEAAATSGSRVLMTGRAGSAAVFDTFNRFSFSTRASGQEEVAQAINFFISDRDLRTPLQNFAVLVEGSSDAADATPTDFADAVLGHVEGELQDRVLPPATIDLQRLNYRANTLDMDSAVEATLQWIVGGTIRTNETGARPVVVVLAGSGKSVSKYVEDVLNAFHDVKLGAANPAAFGLDDSDAQQLQLVDDILFWAPNETGLDTVTAQTAELGTYDTVAGDVPYCSRIVSTQAVPAASPAGTAAGYVSALNALSQTATPTRAGFEGYVAGRVLLEGLKAAPAALSTDALISSLEGLAPVDFGSGGIDYSVSSHVGVPAAAFYEGVSFDEECVDVDLDLDVTPQPPPAAQGCPVGVRLNDVDQICVLQGQFLGDAGPIHLTSDFDYLLKGVVFIGDGSAQAQLIIDPGTTLIGDFETTGTLVITRNADLIADGVHQEAGADETCSVKADCANAGAVCVDGLCASPILFTSEKAVGQRATGDWGGIVINGRAPLNCTQNGQFNAAEGTTAVNGSCQGVGEGGSGLFGGNDLDDNSGVMRFVRIRVRRQAHSRRHHRPRERAQRHRLPGRRPRHRHRLHPRAPRTRRRHRDVRRRRRPQAHLHHLRRRRFVRLDGRLSGPCGSS